MKTEIIILCLMVGGQAVLAQSFSEKISKELSFEKLSQQNALMVANINGTIKVTGYDGDKVLVEVTKSIFAKTDARLETGKAEIQLGVIDRADTLILYVYDGCHQFEKQKGGENRSGWDRQGWGYHSTNNCHLTYDYKMDFTIRIPAALHVIVSTINDGNVVVENVDGIVKAHNINGGIRLTNLKSEANAHTINGDVDIDYALNPTKDCRFYTLNGDINALFQRGLAANLSFESFNGNFYTNVRSLETLPVQVQKTNGGEGVKYKINGNRYQIGSGGALLDFETFNGNVYLKEKTD